MNAAALKAALPKAHAIIQAEPTKFDQRFLMARYQAVVAAAYLLAEKRAASSGKPIAGELHAALTGRAAMRAVNQIDKLGQKRGWTPGLLNLQPSSTPGSAQSTTAPAWTPPAAMPVTPVVPYAPGTVFDAPAPQYTDLDVGIADSDLATPAWGPAADAYDYAGDTTDLTGADGASAAPASPSAALPKWAIPVGVGLVLAFVASR